MNYSIIFRLLAIILWTLAVAMLVSLSMDLIWYHPASLIGLGASAGICAAAGGLLYWLGHSGKPTLHRKEGLATIGLGWLVASLFGALPYIFIHPGHNVASAIFESASGLTTTGASVFADIEEWPRGLLFWRAITQWIGGLGVVVLFVAILSFLGAGAKILYSNESTAQSSDLTDSRVQSSVLRIMMVYAVLSLLCAVGYRLAGMGWYDAVCHMFTTLSTGGFSTRAASFAAFDSVAIELTAIFFMTASGVSFILLIQMSRRRWKEVRQNSELPWYLGILASGIILLTLLRVTSEADQPITASLRESAFQAVSVMTTTGFATEDYTLWRPATHVLLIILMLVGGCTGSTAGGLKVLRILVTFRVAALNIERSFRTHVVRLLRVNGKKFDADEQEGVTTYVTLAVTVIVLSMLVISLPHPELTLEGTVSSVFACFFNIGPGFAEVGPTEVYAFFDDASKVYLALLMIAGRIELYALLVLCFPSLWKRFA